MKVPKHVPILRANEGECEALVNLDERTALRIVPLFEVGPITDAIRERRYFRDSATPTITHLDRVIGRVARAWRNKLAMVDGYQWPANARAENGEHVIPLMVRLLRARGVPVIPVVGYDRWENPEYRSALRSVRGYEDKTFCLRLDSIAVEDADDPDHFEEVVREIVDTLELDPADCQVLIDHGDVSVDHASIDRLVAQTEAIIQILSLIGFEVFIVAGCSLPRTIDLAVDETDSEATIVRKECLVWKTLRPQMGNLTLVSGDYGVRGPTTTEARSRYTNGKIRYSIEGEMFVVRGHAFTIDGDFSQLPDLAATLMRSEHYLGVDFSWGDAQIGVCSSTGKTGNLSHWIAIDTNHHLTLVVQEVEEFERSIVEEEESEDEEPEDEDA